MARGWADCRGSLYAGAGLHRHHSAPASIRKTALSSDVRRRILDAAQTIIDTEGLPALTQPKVAKAAGVRQSHLTYYFPRRTDLLSGLLEHSHESAGHSEPEADLAVELARLLFDPRRARFFLAVVVETCGSEEGRRATSAHMAGFGTYLAARFARTVDDPAVLALMAQLRGMSLQNLVDPIGFEEGARQIAAAARQLGLQLPSNAL